MCPADDSNVGHVSVRQQTVTRAQFHSLLGLRSHPCRCTWPPGIRPVLAEPPTLAGSLVQCRSGKSNLRWLARRFAF